MIADNQGRTFLRLYEELRPHIRIDRNLPGRIQQRLSKERRFGARDRRLYRELLYTAIRYLPWIEEKASESPDAVLAAVVQLAADLPALRPLREQLRLPKAAPFSVEEKACALRVQSCLLPEWFRPHCPKAFESPEIDWLHSRPSLWLRLQVADGRSVFQEFDSLGVSYRTAASAQGIAPSGVASVHRAIPVENAIEVRSEFDVTKTNAYLQGAIEVQDLGSQLLLASVQPAPGSRWLDACAGAGGKTLQLASMVGPDGRVDATDPRVEALTELRLRAKRSPFRNISVPGDSSRISGGYDGVLVDAPCTGTGTWRRSPHLKWCTNENDPTTAAALQLEILQRYATAVRPGGTLVYATCSLSTVENAGVVLAFLQANSEFKSMPPALAFGASADEAGGLTFYPSLHNTDGFYVAAFCRKSECGLYPMPTGKL
jgi:16S rRNA (cytosine967-C5)-methyltransferase